MQTKTPVDELEGRDLDAAVAREVFGLEVREPDGKFWDCLYIPGKSPFAFKWRETDGDRGGEPNMVPSFSEDIGPAWDVVGALPDPVELLRRDDGTWWVDTDACECGGHGPTAYADTAPEAICRAALKAVRGN